MPKELLLLDGLTTLSDDAAQALARRNAWVLILDGLTTLSPAAAQALASRAGKEDTSVSNLSLRGLTALPADAVQTLPQRPGRTEFLGGLARLDVETARVLAAADKWDGRLPSLTAFDSADSAAIATALAARKGPLSLPNLAKISPRTLSALIAKQDVETPPVETLELIPEPDGSATDDFVIPEWLEERENQKRFR
jgi:hypothetical protein